MPDVPTFHELGLTGFEDVPYYGVFAPAGTPKATIDQFSGRDGQGHRQAGGARAPDRDGPDRGPHDARATGQPRAWPTRPPGHASSRRRGSCRSDRLGTGGDMTPGPPASPCSIRPWAFCAFAWTEAGALVGAHLPEGDAATLPARWQRRFPALPEVPELPAPMAGWADRLRAVMAGARDTLEDIQLDLLCVPAFHQRVYAEARKIPPGQTRTYGQLAAALGEPGAARAVGRAPGPQPLRTCGALPTASWLRVAARGGSRPPGACTPSCACWSWKARALGIRPACFDPRSLRFALLRPGVVRPAECGRLARPVVLAQSLPNHFKAVLAGFGMSPRSSG